MSKSRDLADLPAGSGDINIDGGTLFVDASTNRVGIGVTSPAEQLSMTENIFHGSSDGRSQISRGTKFIVDSGSSTVFDICEFTVNYSGVAGRAVAGFVDITIMYESNTSNTRAAVSLAHLRVNAVRGDRAGNQFNTGTDLEIIGTPSITDTGGGTARQVEIGDFATTRTGNANAQQTVTVQFTPPSPLSTVRTIAVSELVELNYGTQMALVEI